MRSEYCRAFCSVIGPVQTVQRALFLLSEQEMLLMWAWIISTLCGTNNNHINNHQHPTPHQPQQTTKQPNSRTTNQPINQSTCEQNTLTRHHVSCACVFDLSSTLSSHSSFVSPISYFILLIFHFLFHVDRFGARSPVHFAE